MQRFETLDVAEASSPILTEQMYLGPQGIGGPLCHTPCILARIGNGYGRCDNIGKVALYLRIHGLHVAECKIAVIGGIGFCPQRHCAPDVHDMEIVQRPEELGLADEAALQLLVHLDTGNVGNGIVGPGHPFVEVGPIVAENAVVGHGGKVIYIVDIGLVARAAPLLGVVRRHVAEHPEHVLVAGEHDVVVDAVHGPLGIGSRGVEGLAAVIGLELFGQEVAARDGCRTANRRNRYV